MRHPRSLARLAAVLALAGAPACKTWQQVRVPEPGQTPHEFAEEARITLKDGGIVVGAIALVALLLLMLGAAGN